ncbi:MAG TPA: DEAD/DEAH box helicase, partial [Blastocatellia bacterium]|nr:DEAD/DEAH box helicase [Blastocatellia bacterium]
MKTAQKLAEAVAANSVNANSRRVAVEDLLLYTPMRYEDRSKLARIRDLKDGGYATAEVEVRVAGSYAVKGGKLRIFEFSAADATGQIRAFWWNQPYLQKTFTRNQRVLLYGEWKRGRRGIFEIENPDYELVAEGDDGTDPIHTGRRVPIYRKLGDIRTKQLRAIVYRVLQKLDPSAIPETIPPDVASRHQLITRDAALRQVHFPGDDSTLEHYNSFQSRAHRRLIFEEFFLLSFAMGLRRQGREQSPKGTIIEVNERVRSAVRRILPFKLTGAQKRVVREIVTDMTSDQPMNRLLQGDVGSGKTIVAVQAAVVAIENGYQAALMVPTEILADQHGRNIKQVLSGSPYRVEVLTGSLPLARKRELNAGIGDGNIDLVVGTHALIQEGVKFQKLGLVIIDEQHRFG